MSGHAINVVVLFHFYEIEGFPHGSSLKMNENFHHVRNRERVTHVLRLQQNRIVNQFARTIMESKFKRTAKRRAGSNGYDTLKMYVLVYAQHLHFTIAIVRAGLFRSTIVFFSFLNFTAAYCESI